MATQFNGHVTMYYLDYIDAATGKTLVCVPGQSYNILPASGRSAASPALPADGRFGASVGREELDPEPDGEPGESDKPARRGVTKQDTSTPEVKEN